MGDLKPSAEGTLTLADGPACASETLAGQGFPWMGAL